MHELLFIHSNSLTAPSIILQLKPKYRIHLFRTNRTLAEIKRIDHFSLIIVCASTTDCLAICRELRSMQVETPILVILPEPNFMKISKVLEAGADNYLTTPFSPSELDLKVRVMLRRPPRNVVSHVQVDKLLIAKEDRTAEINGRKLNLRNREFEILLALAEKRGQALTRELLTRMVCDRDNSPGTNVIDVHIGTIRKKLRKFGYASLIKTVHGVGYKLSTTKL